MSHVSAPSPYIYVPSIPLAVIGAMAFCATTAYLIFECVRKRCWMLFPVIVGALSKWSSRAAESIVRPGLEELNQIGRSVQCMVVNHASNSISSGEVRKAVLEGQASPHIPNNVADYISEHGLYNGSV